MPLPVKGSYFPTDIAIALGIGLITFICFSPILSNHFLFWDDNQYIRNNIYLRRLSWENIKYLFSHQFAANWQPLTMLSYSLNYYFSGYSPGGYFATNLLLHVANTILVFFLSRNILQLVWKGEQHNVQFKNGAFILPALVSLWFGIHPMHVESVGWLFERKDVLYAFFYLAGLLVYAWGMQRSHRKRNLLFTFLLFVLSCLSKPMAVVFPASLVLVDYLGRRLKVQGERRKALIEKIPFFLLSVIMGILTLHTQNEEHAFVYSFSFFSRFLIASYTFLEYMVKLAVPLNLSGFYPYPMNPGEALPAYFYIEPLLLLLFIGTSLYIAFRKDKKLFSLLVFGLGFYFVNIVLVLQFLSVGSAIISDRYSYIAYFGLFFILAYFTIELFRRSNIALRNIILIAVIALTGFWAYLGNRRTLVWHDTGTMLSDVIRQYPKRVPQAYKYLGIYYGETGMNREALDCYRTLIDSMHMGDAAAYCNMGSVYMSVHNLREAVKYLKASLRLDSNQFMSYRNLGIICADTGNYCAALNYYAKANHIYPYDEGLCNNISYAHAATKQFDSAIHDYNILIGMDPDNALYWFNRGVAYYQTGNKDAAVADFMKTLNLPELKQNAPWQLRSNAAYNLSVIFRERGDLKQSSYYEAEAKRLKHR